MLIRVSHSCVIHCITFVFLIARKTDMHTGCTTYQIPPNLTTSSSTSFKFTANTICLQRWKPAQKFRCGYKPNNGAELFASTLLSSTRQPFLVPPLNALELMSRWKCYVKGSALSQNSFVQMGASFICWLEEASTDETNVECML